MDDVADLTFVCTVAERPQQRHGDGVDLGRVDEIAHRLASLSDVERLHHASLPVDTFANAPDAIRRNQWRGPIGVDRMFDAILRQTAPATIGAASDKQRVLETGGDDEPDPGAGAREDHVVNDSATMQKQV